MKALLLTACGLALCGARAFADSTVDPANAFAWSGNVGGVNWWPTTADGVLTGEYVCSGKIWAANAGWLTLSDRALTSS